MIPEFKFVLNEGLGPEFLPTKATHHSVGYDVRAAFNDKKDIIVNSGEYVKIPLGFRCIPEIGWAYELHPRSSFFIKKYMHTLIGIIDEDYSFEVCLCGVYFPKNVKDQLVISHGSTIGQIIPIKRQDLIVTQISNQDFDDLHRQKNFSRTGGFGSTSK